MLSNLSHDAEIPHFHAGQIGERAAALARAGRLVIPMHFGQPTAGAPPSAIAAAQRALEHAPMGYHESPQLKARLVRHYADTYGLAIAPERIVLTCGASAALVAAFSALFAPGERIALTRPGYPAYRNSLQALGRGAVEIECGADVGYRLTAAALAAAPGDPRGVVIASPANPTGATLNRAELAALAEVCRARRIRMISDEIYHGITYGERAVCALEVEPEAIVINSFSKLYRMPGWRLGWMIVPESLVDRLYATVINFFLTPPAISQHAAAAAFDDQADLAASVRDYARNRQLLLAALPELGFGNVVAPEGAFYFYVDVSHLTDDSLAFCRRLLEETGISLAPGIDFDPDGGRRCVRFSFAVTTPEVERAIDILGDWLVRTRRMARGA